MQAIVFDLFHTLVDPEEFRPAGVRRMPAIAAALGVDPEALAAYWGATWQQCEAAGTPVVDHLAAYATARGTSPTADQLAVVDELAGRFQNAAIRSPRPEVLAALDALAQTFRLAVLSNCHDTEVRALASSPLGSRFEAIGLSYEIGYLKPAPEAYASILSRLGLDASECVFVGNGGSGELDGAVRAGFGWVVHQDGFDRVNGIAGDDERRARTASADHRIESITELVGSVPADPVRPRPSAPAA